MSDAVMVPREDARVKAAAVALAVEWYSVPGDTEEARSRAGTQWPGFVGMAKVAIDAALAASTPVGGWEDISTAPVIHGCEVDLWLETGERVADARGFQHNGVIVWHRLSDDGLHERIRAKATHWMFAPPPPSVSTGSRPQEAVPGEGHLPDVLGALRVMRERALELTHKHGNPNGTDYEQGVNDHGHRWVTQFDDVIALLAATPQPADGCSSNEDGWIEWSGGENPVPGRRVVWRNREGDSEACKSDDLAGWKHPYGPGGCWDVIAYRILPQTEKGS